MLQVFNCNLIRIRVEKLQGLENESISLYKYLQFSSKRGNPLLIKEDTKRHYVYDKRQIKDLTYTYGNTNNNNDERQSPGKN